MEGKPVVPAALGGHSILFVGDSLDRNSVLRACSFFGARTSTFLNGSARRDYQYCRLPTAGSSASLTIGHFQNYGVDPGTAPLWRWAFVNGNASNGLHPGTEGANVDSHILRDATRFRQVLPGHQRDPSLVVAQSYLWDLAQHWQNEGHLQAAFQPNIVSFVLQWTANVKRQLLLLRRTFPQAELAWRTAPPAAGQGRSAETMRAMSNAARALLAEDAALRRVRLIDWASELWAGENDTAAIFNTYTDGMGHLDGTHPGRMDSLGLVSLALDVLCEQQGMSCPTRQDRCALGNFPSGTARWTTKARHVWCYDCF